MQILLTGVSSGIGEILAQKLKGKGHKVMGISRRKTAFTSIQHDLSKPKTWEKILQIMKRRKFKPDVVIFNAAIQLNDLNPNLDPKLTKKMFDTNFFSIIDGINILLNYVKPKTHFITVSSTSAFKGSGKEGIGYASSKAALSLAFESLYHQFKNRFHFSLVYFGPVSTGMRGERKHPPLTLTGEEAASAIIEVINNKTPISYHPKMAFLVVKLIKLLPQNLHLKIFSFLEGRLS